MTHSELLIYTDGGARGNPGPAGIGVAVYTPDNELVTTSKKFIGESTNNVAEYTAALTGLQIAKEYKAEIVHMYLDSELVVKQLNREYKVKNKDLGSIFVQIWNLSQEFKKVTFTHIPREENKIADGLVNQALDEQG
ncbi:MAG: ribonuclease HI family protein [Patescibacteria group bacterium]